MCSNPNKPGQFNYRDVSCFCYEALCQACSCFEPKLFEFNTVLNRPASTVAIDDTTHDITNDTTRVSVSADTDATDSVHPSKSSPIQAIEHFDASLVGQHCIVKYNKKAYPVRILSVVETDLEVECMHSLRNRYDSYRFCWPEKVKDTCMCMQDDIICLIPEPTRMSDHGRSSNTFKVLPEI